MKLTVVGCSGSYPGPDSACSSYLVEHDGFRLLIDLGTGAIGPLQRHANLTDLDAVVISHLHADHFFDLYGYAIATRFYISSTDPLPLYGPAGTVDRVAAVHNPSTTADELRDAFEFTALQPCELMLGPFSLQLELMNHSVETYGMRISVDDASLTYSSDTGKSQDLVELARDTDLFLCEASYAQPGPPGLHLTAGEAAEHAELANARRLILTHMPPTVDPEHARQEAGAVFAGHCEVARAGASYEV